MINFGFTQAEMNIATMMFNNSPTGSWVPKLAQQWMGNDYFQYQDIVKYAFSCLCDDGLKEAKDFFASTQVVDDYELCSNYVDRFSMHFKKMFQRFNRGNHFYTPDEFHAFGLKTEVNSYAKFRDLPEPFDIYNDGTYEDDIENRYKIEKKPGNKTTKVITGRAPEIKREKDLDKINDNEDGVKLEKSELETDKWILEVDNKYVGVMNRYAICISTKPPQIHYGMIAMVNGCGNKIYVYACELSKDYNVDKRIANRFGVMSNFLVVCAYGFSKKELEKQLMLTATNIEKACDVRVKVLVRPETEFEEGVTWLWEKEETLDDSSSSGDDIFSEDSTPSAESGGNNSNEESLDDIF